MKNFKSLYKEYANLNPAFAVGGSSTGPGMGQYNPTADLNLRASKQAVSGNKVAKFVTGHDVKFGNKKYKKVEFEVLDVDNNSKSVKVTFISPKELENKVVKMPFKFLRRGPFVATKIPNQFEAVEKYDSDKFFGGKGTPEQRTQLLKLQNKALRALGGSPRQKAIKKDIDALRKKMGMKVKEELELDDIVERNYRKEYDNYQGKPEQIERRSSRNKARRLMGDKAIKGKDVGHKDNNPLNNDPKNLKMEDPSKNRREPRLRK